MKEQIAKRNRSQVVIMLVAFPLLCAFGVYSLIWLAERGVQFTTTNHGDFVDPPVLARELGLLDENDAPVDGRVGWWVWLATADCAASCRRSLDTMRALRQRLSDHDERIGLALVTPRRPKSVPSSAQYPQTRRFTSDGEKALDAGIYLVDPAGNVVLRYPSDSPPAPILEDLRRLLEVSEDDL